jgi:hypothetical protein
LLRRIHSLCPADVVLPDQTPRILFLSHPALTTIRPAYTVDGQHRPKPTITNATMNPRFTTTATTTTTRPKAGGWAFRAR